MNGILLETHRETHSPHLYTSLNLFAERTKQSSKCEKWHLKIWPCSSIFRNSPISVRNHWHMKMPALSKEALEASSKGFTIGKEIPGQMNFLEVKRNTRVNWATTKEVAFLLKRRRTCETALADVRDCMGSDLLHSSIHLIILLPQGAFLLP